MNKRRTISRVVSDFKELRRLLVFGFAEDDGNVEVAQTQLFCFSLFFGGAMFARRPQVNDGLNAFVLELLQMLESWLAAGTELVVNAEEVPDGRNLLLRDANGINQKLEEDIRSLERKAAKR